MGLELRYEKGQTPIDEEEKDDLLLPTISTRRELDEFEQANIEKAIEWSLKIQNSVDELLSIEFIKELHLRMFSEVWGWAGTFRKSNKNIAIRYKFRMLSIHPFPNGNGRHSRISGDILVSKVLKRPVFSWGGNNIGKEGETRKRYLESLYMADRGDIGDLLKFARSGKLT